MVLNRRLPRITARDVCPIAQLRGSWSAQRTNKPVTRGNVRGSRLFNEICGHARAETNITGFRIRSKAAPLQAVGHATPLDNSNC
jgi:hypothetical protein